MMIGNKKIMVLLLSAFAMQKPVFLTGDLIEGDYAIHFSYQKNIDRSKINLLFDDGRIDTKASDDFYIHVSPQEFKAYSRNMGTPPRLTSPWFTRGFRVI